MRKVSEIIWFSAKLTFFLGMELDHKLTVSLFHVLKQLIVHNTDEKLKKCQKKVHERRHKSFALYFTV